MRLIYTSPRSENIDRVVALFAERGIESTVSNRSNWKRNSYQRFSYTQPRADRDSWAQVWVTHAEDYTNARALMRDIGIEPLIRHGEELAAARNPKLQAARNTPARVRRTLLLVLIIAVAAYQALHYYFHLI